MKCETCKKPATKGYTANKKTYNFCEECYERLMEYVEKKAEERKTWEDESR